MNAMERLVDILVAVFLMFLLPLLYYGSGKEISRTVLAGQAGENFLKRICTAGEISLPVWRELEAALNKYDCDNVEILRERYLYEPDGTNGNVVRRLYEESKESLLVQLHEDGRCKLQKGDCMKLTIYINETPMLYFDYVRTGATES